MFPASSIPKALLAIGAFAVLIFGCCARSHAQTGDEAQIRALEDRFAAAFKAKDVDKIMAIYEHSQSLIAFDVVPRSEFAGWDAYRKDWQDFFAAIGPVQSFAVKDLTIHSDGRLAYGYSFQHYVAESKAGKPIDLTVRVTDVYKNTGGRWLIVQEHVSLPVDLRTGEAELQFHP